MPRQSRVSEILERMMESKETPEQACAECPELLPAVCRRWSQLNGVEAKLDTFFPSPNSAFGSTKPFRPSQKRPEIAGYEIGEILGRGAVGVVYKAMCLKLNRNVALKMLLSGIYASATELKRFLREAESIASLRHINFVQVYEVGDFDGCPYFTMEFVEGGTLSQKLNGVPLPSKQAATLIKTLAEAMQIAHASGIIHRDLKPSNILLTSEGIPKVSDFGLARRLEAKSDLTHSGDRVGTPCYMAPEQAKGRSNSVGQLADIYSLGAILYELLTGRPPFQGETPGETERQLLTIDPAPPSRLNAKVPRDLETICLKCLQKDPPKRYASAAELGLDLNRFQRGEPISARPVGVLERSAKMIKRHPAMALSTFGIAVLAAVAISAALWFIAQRAATARVINDDLQQVTQFESRSDWNNARLAQERVKARMSGFVPSAMRARAARNDLDLALIFRIETDRLTNIKDNGPSNRADLRAHIKEALADAGIGTTNDPPEVVAARIESSAIKPALTDVIYDLIGASWGVPNNSWQLSIEKQIDPKGSGWTQAVLTSDLSKKEVLSSLLANAPYNDGSRHLVATLATMFQSSGGDGISILKKLQREKPGEFWTTYVLAEACMGIDQRSEAIRYYQAAQALRPDIEISYTNLAIMLSKDGRKDEALDEFRSAIAVSPNSFEANANLGINLYDMGRYPEAVDALRRAVQVENAPVESVHGSYAVSLDAVGNLDEALDQYKLLIAFFPSQVMDSLPMLDFIQKGHGEDIRLAWEKSLDSQPRPLEAYSGYPELCLYIGKVDEYSRARDTLLKRFGATKDPRTAEQLGKMCLLVPASQEQTRIANDLINLAVHSHPPKNEAWTMSYFMFSKALAEYRSGDYEKAIANLNGEAGKVMGPAPLLITAMSQFRLGNVSDARKAFKTAIYSFNWSPSFARFKEAWVYEILLREAETMFLPHLTEFEAGTYVPQDNEERIELFGYCQSNSLYTAAARLYSDAFIAHPALADDISNGYRYRAACAAVAAGCGNCKDAGALSIAEKKSWRDQALLWVMADLAAREHRVATNTDSRRDLQNALWNWDHDPDMAFVRDPKLLQKLEPHERDQWETFWEQIEAHLVTSVIINK